MSMALSKKILLTGTALVAVSFAGVTQARAADTAVNTTGTFAVTGGGTAGDTVTFTANGTGTVADGVAIGGVTTTNVANTGTLTFAGASAVTGNVGSGALPINTINVNGNNTKTVAFAGTVNSQSLVFGSNGVATFNGNTAITNAIGLGTATINVGTGATLTATGGITGGTGTVVLDGTGTLAGGAASVATLNHTSAGTGVVSSNLTAGAVNVTGGALQITNTSSTVSGATAIGANTLDFSGASLAAVTGTGGTLKLSANGAQAVTGAVGTVGNALTSVNINGTGTKTFSNANLYATYLTFTAAGTADISASTTAGGTNIGFGSNNGAAIYGAATTYSGAITGTGGNGNVTFGAGSSVTGTIGSVGDKVGTITFGTGSNTISNAIYATTVAVGAGTVAAANSTFDAGINYTADGIVTLVDATTVTGAVTAAAPDTGTLTFAGSGGVTGAVGAGNAIKMINVNGDNTKTVTFANNVNTKGLAFGSNGNAIFNGATNAVTDAIALGTAKVAVGTGATLTATGGITGGTGAVVVDGTGTLAGGAAAVATLEKTSAGTGIVSSALTAGALTVTAGTLQITNAASSVTGTTAIGANTLEFAGSGLAAVTGAGGTLKMTGTGAQTVSGAVGSAGNALAVVNIGGTGTTTFQNADFYATNLTFGAAGTADLTATTTTAAQNIGFGANNGTVTYGAGVTYTGAVTATGGNGDVTFGNGAIVNGTIGTVGNKIANLSFGGGANTIANAVYATTVNVGAGTVTAANTTFDSGVSFTADGTLNLAANTVITGNVGAVTAGQGTIADTGVLTINGNLGRLKSFVAANTLNVGGSMVAADTTNVGTQTINVGTTFATTANTALTYRVNTPTTSGKIIASGNLTIDANTAVNMVVDTNVYVANGQKFVLVDGNDAGTGVATLAAGKLVTTDTTLLHFKQETTNTHDLVVYADRTQIATVSTDANNAAVGKVFDAIGVSTNTQINAFQVALGQATTATQVNNLLATVVVPTQTGQVAVSTATNSIANVVGAHLTSNVPPSTISMAQADTGTTGMAAGNAASNNNVWIQGFGAGAQQGLRNGAAGYDVGSYGTVVGVDKEVVENLRVGVNFAYAQTNVNGEDLNRTGTDVDSYQGGVYGSYDFGDGYFANGQMAYMYNNIDSVRYNVGGVATNTARASYHSSQYSARTEGGRSMAVPYGLTLTPSAIANYSYMNTSRYSETGAGGLSLSNVKPDDSQMFELGLRMKAEAGFNDGMGGKIKPNVQVGYRYDLIGDQASSVAGFVGGGTTFTSTGTKPARGTADAGLGLTWASSYDVDVSAQYDYEHKSGYNSNSGYLRAGYKF